MSPVAPSLRLAKLNIITKRNALSEAIENFLTVKSSADRAIAQLQIIEQMSLQSLTEFDLNISASSARQDPSPAAKTARSRGK